jgi:tetratricopeptide (TPR) repeat protein
MTDFPTINQIPSEEPDRNLRVDSNASGMETKTFQSPGASQQVVQQMEAFLGMDSGGTVDQAATHPTDRESTGNSPLPSIPGYEIEKELGRGGMGVVYLARHVRLKRRVALKVIRGACAGKDDVDRFRTEAEAVAAFQHTNIVQVFEVGEYGGLPFCALEFVDGGSLHARLGRRPIPASEAASLTETLARAMHHAHQKGIVHRDLKPANVLVTSDGVPKVTDFGLAKRLGDEDSGLTQTGAVMGTPAYMAPEQAGGHTREAGPPADVYALGAMLYEFLTGKPPFIGATTLETIQKVLHEDPVAPSKLVPVVPRDLETICLKCLSKNPAGRYSSALALAQDVERFRAGEPILGRRESVVRKMWRRARKRATFLVAGVLVAAAAVVAVLATSESGSTRRLATLSREFEEGLTAENWPADRRDHLEQVASRLATLDPAQGEAARRKLIERIAARVRDALKQPRVQVEDLPALETQLAWLEKRDPDLAAHIRQELSSRMRDWQPRVELTPPFTNARAVFPGEAMEVGMDGLRRKPGMPVQSTLVPSHGQIRVTAEFAADWQSNQQLGVHFHVPAQATFDANKTGYGFVLAAVPERVVKEDGSRIVPVGRNHTFRETGRSAEIRLTRNGVVLQTQSVRVADRPVRILAEHNGDLLRIQVNDLPAVTFTDVVPLIGDDSAVIGLDWSGSAALVYLRVEESAIPPLASPLEKADAQFERGRNAEALQLYLEQIRGGGPVVSEACTKAGLCLVALNRPEEAARQFEQAMASTGDRWPVIAAAQLWLLRLRAKQVEQADALYAAISVRFSRERLAQYVPIEVRQELAGFNKVPPINYLIPDMETVARFEATDRVADLLQVNMYDRLNTAIALALVREYGRSEAMTAQRMKELLPPIGVAPEGYQQLVFYQRWQCWALRAMGNRKEALAVASDRVANYANRKWSDPATAQVANASFAPLRLELTKCYAAMEQWPKAEAEIDAFLRDFPQPVEWYTAYSDAHLMRGFLLSRRGDEKGARAAWKLATYPAFLEQLPPAKRPTDPAPPGHFWGPVNHWIAASFADTLTDREMAGIFQHAMGVIASDPLYLQMLESLKLSPAFLQGIWRSPRGREVAWKFAFLDIEPVDYFRLMPTLVAYERIRQDLFAGQPTKEQDDLIWKTMSSVVNLACERKLTKPQMLQVAMAWKGVAGTFGWAGVAGALPPEVRGPSAYLMGLKYLKTGKTEDAKKILRDALEVAAADSPLRKLVSYELAKLKE